MDIYLDTLLHLPFATVENFQEVDNFIYFKIGLIIGLINEEIECPHCQKKLTEIHQTELCANKGFICIWKKGISAGTKKTILL